MNKHQNNEIPEVFLEALKRGSRLDDEYDSEKGGELFCDRCEDPVPVAAFNFWGFPSEPMMETICEYCFEEGETAMNIVITWKGGPKEAHYKKCADYKRIDSMEMKGITTYEC